MFIAVILLLPLLLCVQPADGADALQLFKNYFVTGDYAVGGVGLRGQGDSSGFASNTITTSGIPAGADIVAAFLYWETAERTADPSSTKGFFGSASGPVYPIAGKPIGSKVPPCWSSATSQGTLTLRVYRADVKPFLPFLNGRQQGNGSFQVRLPDSGSSEAVPSTYGASLVIVYRLLAPGVPLKAVVIYDGAFTMTSNSPRMIQTVRGFYQAVTPTVGTNPARLTHIVANGRASFSEGLYFQTIGIATSPFLGAQGPSWDNPTFDVSQYVADNASWVRTQIVPLGSNFDCLSWGALIFSTPVKDSDGDGLLDVWEQGPPAPDPHHGSPGYYDAKTESWVALPGAVNGVKDVFVEIDYLNKTGVGAHSHLPKQAALDTVGAAFKTQGIQLHFDAGNNYQSPPDPYIVPYSGTPAGGNAIDEDSLTCRDSADVLCEFPGQPGIVSWKGGFRFLENEFFQHGRKDSYHYVLFGHALGLATASWSVALGTLSSIVDSGTTATVTTSTPHGLTLPARVTVSGALAPFRLNGTYVVRSILSPSTFTISTRDVPDGLYNNYGLAVATGPVESTSGWSDLGGGDLMVTLGLWHADDAPGCQANPAIPLAGNQTYCDDQVGSVQVQAGTLMHELGHNLGLTHGGTYFDSPVPTYGLNCKPNFQSVMNYLFQIRGLPDYDGRAHVDFSGQVLPGLSEGALNESAGLGSGTPYRTRWYGPPNFLDSVIGRNGSAAATRHCDGSPLLPTDPQMIRLEGPFSPGGIDWNNDGGISGVAAPQDANLDGSSSDPQFRGYNDWANLQLQQIGARRNAFGFSADVISGDLLGGGGGDLLGGGGGDLLGGGGGDLLGGGGGDLLGGGGGALVGGGAGEEFNDFDLANATVDAPAQLTAAQPGAFVRLNWTPPGFGQIRTYFIWRADTTSGPISPTNPPQNIGQRTGAPPEPIFTDPNVLNGHTYTYFVTAALASSTSTGAAQSGPSNLVSITVHLGGGI